MKSRVVVLLPALNEEEALPHVLPRIPSWVAEIVVADNGSTDGTAAVARELGATVVPAPERGYGAACLAGLRHLAEEPEAPDIVVFLDADGSENPDDVARLVTPIEDGIADLVLGVRRGVGGDVGTILPHARLGNALVLALMRVLHGAEFQDLPPFRAIRYSSLVSLEMDDRNWGWTLQMQLRAARRGLETHEVEIEHRRRTHGESKISGSLPMSIRVGGKMMWTLVRERLRS
ncbi:MAG: glycosyltransferase family 2 protein [Gemmatimonadota bacterium]